MSKLEKDDERSLKKWCKDNSLIFIKFTPLGERGWPDRILPVNGYTLWIELKKKGEKPEKLQAYRMAQLVKEGQQVAWFDNVTDCIQWIKGFL